MMDETKRKRLIYASIAFITIIIILFIGFLIFNKKGDLPPIEPDAPGTSDTNTNTKTDAAAPVTVEPTAEESTVVKNGIIFEQFDELSRYAITETRIDVVLYYLAEYASTQSTGAITTFTLDTNSVKETTEEDRTIFTFTTKDNTNNSYKVELSYVYAADAYVRIFDKDNTIVQTSPLN